MRSPTPAKSASKLDGRHTSDPSRADALPRAPQVRGLHVASRAAMSPASPRTALVLSGGGARGAYAVGVLLGIHAVLGNLRSRFQLFTGTSVGAINAAQFAAFAD